MMREYHRTNAVGRWRRFASAGIICVLPLFAAGWGLRAQEPTNLAFDVASIKPSDGRKGIYTKLLPSGIYTATNFPLPNMVRYAFGIKIESLLVGMPDWTKSAYFSISARTSVPHMTDSALLQSILVRRFNLRVHTENRRMPVYALVPARRDGQLGPSIRPTQPGECDGAGAAECGTNYTAGNHVVFDRPLSELIRNLAPLDRVVVDGTGLKTRFNWTLKWEPDPAVPNGVPLFTALQEQLGLKLDPRTGPVEVLVVDRIERPTAD